MNFIKIPNAFLTEFRQASELKLACVFMGLIHKNTAKNLLGWEITVKQKTLARLCGCSVVTVQRTIKSLASKGFIVSMQRSARDRKLGTYRYVVKNISMQRGYFYMQRKALLHLNGTAFKVYAHFCKLADGSTHQFFQSINELCSIIGIGKKELIECINALISAKLIRKKRRMTAAGDYTDNLYTVTTLSSGTIRKKRKKNVPSANLKSFRNTNINFIYIVNDYIDFVKSFLRKNIKKLKKFLCGNILKRKRRRFYRYRGSG